MISMTSLKISKFLERAPLPQTRVAQARPRLATAEAPPGRAVEAGRPEHERRVTANRRVLERRASEQAAFLDTRIGHSRRRNAGRRAEDLQAPALRKSISTKA